MTSDKTHRLTINLSLQELTDTIPLLLANGLDFTVTHREKPKPGQEIAGELVAAPHVPLRTNGAAKAVVEDIVSDEPMVDTKSGRKRAQTPNMIEPNIKDGALRKQREEMIETLTDLHGRRPVFTQYAGLSLMMIIEGLTKDGHPVPRDAITHAWAATDFSGSTLGYTLNALRREGMIIRDPMKSVELSDMGKRELFYHKGTMKL